jgi:50S ribosomal subunit-associated GTPase HflX
VKKHHHLDNNNNRQLPDVNSEYGLGSDKAEEIKEFTRECKMDKITVEEHFHFKTDRYCCVAAHSEM